MSNSHAERREVAILLAPQLGHREAAYRFDVAQVVADLVQIALRQFANVVAAITVFRQRRMLAQELLRAHPHRDGEILDLLAGIVVVELAGHRGALPFDEPRQRVAQRGLAAMADVQRPRRIRRDEFDHHALAGARIAAAESLALGEYVRTTACRAAGVTKMLMNPAPAISIFSTRSDLRQRGDQRLRELARISLQRLRVLQRDVRREVAVLRLLRTIELDRRAGALGATAACARCADSSAKIGHRRPRTATIAMGTGTAN